MKRLLSSAMLGLILSLAVHAQPAPDTATLTTLLQEFLAGASRNDAAVHDRFWADDVIYTGSGGRRRGKAEIMRDVRSAPAPKPGDPTTTYTAEDIRIQQYGQSAIVAFRLVGTTQRAGGKTEITNHLNSGTFIKRNSKWQVVNWQATRVPVGEAEAKKEVAAADAALHQAILAGDVKQLASLIDESFIWTQTNGETVNRQRLLDDIGSGRLKYSQLENNNVTVSIYGDTGVVRASSQRRRSSIPTTPGTGDVASFKAFYTLMFVRQGGAWKAVAMHSSRP
ncbi:MAG: nuclear transport factor 2 family protein [Pyrinomonadaceae bacterium]